MASASSSSVSSARALVGVRAGAAGRGSRRGRYVSRRRIVLRAGDVGNDEVVSSPVRTRRAGADRTAMSAFGAGAVLVRGGRASCRCEAGGSVGDGNTGLVEPCDNAYDEILRGVAIFNEDKAGNADLALECFKRSLTLEGSGVRRVRDKPRELSPSERQAALYNTACAFCAKGEAENALLAIGSCLEAGFKDFKTLRSDPDLRVLREQDGERLEKILERFEPGWFMRLFSGDRSAFKE